MRIFFLFFFLFFTETTLGNISFSSNVTNGIAIDYVSNTVIGEKNSDKKISPASMSKIMTAIIVFDQLKLKKMTINDHLEVPKNIRSRITKDDTKMFILPGDKISVDDLLKGLIVLSGIDAAITLAEGLAGSEQQFVDLMNKKAAEIGMNNTLFKNSSGVFDFEHFTTVKDISILSSYLIKNYGEFYGYFKEKKFLWVRTGGKPIQQYNRNVLLTDDNVDGIKTGNLKDSKYSIAATKKINNRRVIVVISGLPTMTSRADEVRRIFLQYFNRTELALIPYDNDLFRIDIWNGSVSSLNVRGSNKEGIYFIKNKGQKILKPRIEIEYETPTKIPIVKGEHIANAKVFNGRELIHIERLYAEKNVTEKNIFLKGWQNIKYSIWN